MAETGKKEEETPEHLTPVDELKDRVQLQGYRFAIFALCFYFAVPIFYWWLWAGLSPLDAFYFCVVTFSSVGYGDITPHTKAERIWTTFFILVGVAVTANMVGVLTSLVNEHRERRLAEARQAAEQNKSSNSPVHYFLRVRDATWAMMEEFDGEVRKYFDYVTGFVDLQVDILERRLTGEITQADLEEKPRQSNGWLGWMEPTRPSRASSQAQYDRTVVTSNTRGAIEDIRRMKSNLHRSAQDMRYQTFHDFLYVWVLILTGALSMQVIEEWKLSDAYYWSVVTVTTVGYGDVVPTTHMGKLFTIGYILIGTVLMAKTLGNLIMAPIEIRMKKNEILVMEQFEANMTATYFQALVDNPLMHSVKHLRRSPEELTKAEFMIVVLSTMNKLQDEDIETAGRIFDRYDLRDQGYLTQDVIDLHFKVARQKDEKTVATTGKARRPSYLHVYHGGNLPAGDGDGVNRRGSATVNPMTRANDLEDGRRSISLRNYEDRTPMPPVSEDSGHASTHYVAMKD